MKRIPKLQPKPRQKCTTILIYQEKNEEEPKGRPWGCTNEAIPPKIHQNGVCVTCAENFNFGAIKIGFQTSTEPLAVCIHIKVTKTAQVCTVGGPDGLSIKTTPW